MAALTRLVIRSLRTNGFIPRQILADQVPKLRKQLSEGEILLGYRCWEQLADEELLENEYWQLRSVLQRQETKRAELLTSERSLDETERKLRELQEAEGQDEAASRGKIPNRPLPEFRLHSEPSESEGKPARNFREEVRRPSEVALPGFSRGNALQIRQQAQALQRRYKTLQTRLRVRREDGAEDDEIDQLRTQLAQIRRDFDQHRRALALAKRQAAEAAQTKAPSPRKSNLDGEVERKPLPEIEAELSLDDEAQESTPPSTKPPKPVDPPAPPSPHDLLRRERREARSLCEKLRAQIIACTRERDETLREIGFQLRRAKTANSTIKHLREQQRELIQRLNQLSQRLADLSR